MLWTRYALLAGKPWQSLTDICAQHLESPGNKAYAVLQTPPLSAAARDASKRR